MARPTATECKGWGLMLAVALSATAAVALKPPEDPNWPQGVVEAYIGGPDTFTLDPVGAAPSESRFLGPRAVDVWTGGLATVLLSHPGCGAVSQTNPDNTSSTATAGALCAGVVSLTRDPLELRASFGVTSDGRLVWIGDGNEIARGQQPDECNMTTGRECAVHVGWPTFRVFGSGLPDDQHLYWNVGDLNPGGGGPGAFSSGVGSIILHPIGVENCIQTFLAADSGAHVIFAVVSGAGSYHMSVAFGTGNESAGSQLANSTALSSPFALAYDARRATLYVSVFDNSTGGCRSAIVALAFNASTETFSLGGFVTLTDGCAIGPYDLTPDHRPTHSLRGLALGMAFHASSSTLYVLDSAAGALVAFDVANASWWLAAYIPGAHLTQCALVDDGVEPVILLVDANRSTVWRRIALPTGNVSSQPASVCWADFDSVAKSRTMTSSTTAHSNSTTTAPSMPTSAPGSASPTPTPHSHPPSTMPANATSTPNTTAPRPATNLTLPDPPSDGLPFTREGYTHSVTASRPLSWTVHMTSSRSARSRSTTSSGETGTATRSTTPLPTRTPQPTTTASTPRSDSRTLPPTSTSSESPTDALTATAPITRTATATHIPPKPPAPPLMQPIVVSVLAGIGTGATFFAAVMSGSAAVGDAQSLVLIGQLACASEATRNTMAPSNPLLAPLAIGEGSYAELAVCMTLLVAFAVLHGLSADGVINFRRRQLRKAKLAESRHRRRQQGRDVDGSSDPSSSEEEAELRRQVDRELLGDDFENAKEMRLQEENRKGYAAARFPAVTITVFHLMLPGMVFYSAKEIVDPAERTVVGTVLGAFGVAVAVMVIGAAGTRVSRATFDAVFLRYKFAFQEYRGGWVRSWCLPRGLWAGGVYAKRFGPLFKAAKRSRVVWWIAVIIPGRTLALGVLAGINPIPLYGEGTCWAQFLVLALLCAAYAVAVVVVRPFRMPLMTLIAALNQVSIILMCVSQMTPYLQDEMALAALVAGLVVSVVAAVSSIAQVALERLVWLPREVKRRRRQKPIFGDRRWAMDTAADEEAEEFGDSDEEEEKKERRARRRLDKRKSSRRLHVERTIESTSPFRGLRTTVPIPTSAAPTGNRLIATDAEEASSESEAEQSVVRLSGRLVPSEMRPMAHNETTGGMPTSMIMSLIGHDNTLVDGGLLDGVRPPTEPRRHAHGHAGRRRDLDYRTSSSPAAADDDVGVAFDALMWATLPKARPQGLAVPSRASHTLDEL
jgi:hypothetical protein